ncbi:hypothetical protein BC829DRAFT_399394 [Chytridium lagenaria]|nr:hypothetical protein BC829DRAFT_399394 [Chytridium lagenaria]
MQASEESVAVDSNDTFVAAPRSPSRWVTLALSEGHLAKDRERLESITPTIVLDGSNVDLDHRDGGGRLERKTSLKGVDRGQSMMDGNYTSIIKIRPVTMRRSPNKVGVSPISAALQEHFDSHPINAWLARFVEKDTELEFLLSHNCSALKANQKLVLMGILGLFLYSGGSAAMTGVYFDTYLSAIQVAIGIIALVATYLTPKPIVVASHHYTMTIFVSVSENFTEFRIFIYATSTLMLYIASTIVQQPLVSAFLLTVYMILAPWITVTIGTGSTNPCFCCLMTTRDREIKLRNIYLMEKLISTNFGISLEDIQGMSTSDILSNTRFNGLVNNFSTQTFGTDMIIKPSSRWSRFKRWVKKDVLVWWENELLQSNYLVWRQATFLFHLRTNFCILAFFDLYSSFINPLGFCKLRELYVVSPSLCGEKGHLLRNLRLALSPALMVAFALSFVKAISNSSKASQLLLVVTFSLRGLVSHFRRAMYGLIMKWDRLDETNYLILSTLIAQYFVSCGSSLLLMEMYFLQCLILIIGSVVMLLATRVALILLILLLTIATLMAATYNIQMEKNEHRFFALWEVLCGQPK